MRRKSVVTVDDMGEAKDQIADVTVELTLSGTTYKWDLTTANADTLRTLVTTWAAQLAGPGDRTAHIVLDGKRHTLRGSTTELAQFRADLTPWTNKAVKRKLRVVRQLSKPPAEPTTSA